MGACNFHHIVPFCIVCRVDVSGVPTVIVTPVELYAGFVATSFHYDDAARKVAVTATVHGRDLGIGQPLSVDPEVVYGAAHVRVTVHIRTKVEAGIGKAAVQGFACA